MESTQLSDLFDLLLRQDPLLAVVIILLVRIVTQGRGSPPGSNTSGASSEARKGDSKNNLS